MQSKSKRNGLTIVGIGEDGWDGLAMGAKAALSAAAVIVGNQRQLDLLPDGPASRRPWPKPLLPAIAGVMQEAQEQAVVVLASGDPLLHGIGATFARHFPQRDFEIIPHVSAFSLACARLRWPSEETTLVSVVQQPYQSIRRYFIEGRKLVVYSRDARSPQAIADILIADGYGASTMHVFARLGGAHERRQTVIPHSDALESTDNLNLVAIKLKADQPKFELSSVPGLPDDAFEHQGQITKRAIRALSLAQLNPLPGHMLWDVGAGTGSIAIEWMRVHPHCRAIAFEANELHIERIRRNAMQLGVPDLGIVPGEAPASFVDCATPDAIFIGGGMSTHGMIASCWQHLRRGGRLVVNAVTIESEASVLQACATYGGELTRIALSSPQKLGAMHCWRPALPITQWAVKK